MARRADFFGQADDELVRSTLRRVHSAAVLERELEFKFDVRAAVERFRASGGEDVMVAVASDAADNGMLRDLAAQSDTGLFAYLDALTVNEYTAVDLKRYQDRKNKKLMRRFLSCETWPTNLRCVHCFF